MQCTSIKENDEQCQANAINDSSFCFSHDPNMEESKRIATTRGGMAPKKNYDPLPPIKIDDSKDIIRLLVTTIGEVRQGAIDIRVANCVGFLAGHLIKAFEIGELNEKLELFNSLIIERKRR